MKILKVLIMFILLMTFLPINTEAHPGRTDGNGGHTCKTNCTEKWGMPYGQYHYHNGGKSTTSNSSVKKSSPTLNKNKKENDARAKKEAEAIKAKEIAKAEEAGYNDGLKDGYNNSKKARSSKYQGAYNKGYKEGFAKGVTKLANEKNKAYRAGYNAAEKGISKAVPEEYKVNSYISSSYIEGYNRFKVEIEKEKYYKMGYEDGSKMKEFKKPNFEKDSYVRWYKEGFEAYKKANSKK